MMKRSNLLIAPVIAGVFALTLLGCPAELSEMTLDAYKYLDLDADGICDTCGQGVDADGDGVCDNYVDADGDGICDNYQSHKGLGRQASGYQLWDENGDGVCDLCNGIDADGDGICDNFVDEDGDGICDNRQSHAQYGWGAGGYQFRDQNGDGVCDVCGGVDADGDGICDNFVDEDGDGICDNRQSHAQNGHHHGQGNA